MRPMMRLCFFLFLGLTACASGNCRQNQKTQSQKAENQQKSLEQIEKAASKDHVLVYKLDGSKQCFQEPGISIEKMAQELKGIKIYNSYKTHDGKIRTRMCGQSQGVINIYEIKASQKEKALEKGFELLSSQE